MDEFKNSANSGALKFVVYALLGIVLVQFYVIEKDGQPKQDNDRSLHAKTAAPLPVSPTNPKLNAEAVEEEPVHFRVSGQVAQMRFKENDAVRQGDVLATLDKQPYEKAVASAHIRLQASTAQENTTLVPNPNYAGIEQARAELAAAQHTYDVAKDELARYTASPLYRPDDNIYRDDVQNVHDDEAELTRAKRELAHQQAIGLAQLQENGYHAGAIIAKNHMEDAEDALDETTLIATSDGIITGVNAAVGDKVTPDNVIYVLAVPKSPTAAGE